MMITLVIALFAVLVSSNTNYYGETQQIVLNATAGPSVFLIQANPKNMSKLVVETTANLIWCFQAQFSLFNNYNNTLVISRNPKNWLHRSCTFTVQTSGNVVTEIPLDMVPYAVGIFFNDSKKQNFTHANVTIGATDDHCAVNGTQIATSAGTCVTANEITDFTKINAPSKQLTAYRFKLSATQITSSFTIECKDNTTQLDYWIRRDGTPATRSMMGKCPGPKTVVGSPRNGVFGYYLFVENNQEKDENLSIDFVLCSNQTGGEGCSIKIRNATTTPTLLMMGTETYYFKINATKTSGVWINVRRINGTLVNVVNPLIFASLNQLPTATDADIVGCNEFYCDLVNVINFTVTENQTWYIGIQNSDVMYNDSKSGIWFNTICAPDCQNHGTCTDTGAQIGFCDCIDGFIGVDCELPNGFGPQFIVLIIIAVLVALTAVIGFGAWAYMRRKRGQYDIVS